MVNLTLEMTRRCYNDTKHNIYDRKVITTKVIIAQVHQQMTHSQGTQGFMVTKALVGTMVNISIFM